MQGLVDIAALDDGRAIAVTEFGGVSLSTDGGKTFRDARTVFRGSPGEPVVREGGLWITDRLAQTTRALQVDKAGNLIEYTSLPPTVVPPKSDPRFGYGDSPLRAALRTGVQLDSGRLLFGIGGDILELEPATSAVVRSQPGVLPTNMACEAFKTDNDVVFACSESNGWASVISGVLSKKPTVEKSFFFPDGAFFIGADNTLVFSGPCTATVAVSTAAATPAASSATTPSPSPRVYSACVRLPTGEWESSSFKEDISSSTGLPIPAPAPSAVRWVPRAGQMPIAVIVESDGELTFVEPSSGRRRTIQLTSLPTAALPLLKTALEIQKPGTAPRPRARIGLQSRFPLVIDRRFLISEDGAMVGILDDGTGLEIHPDGRLQVYPFKFEAAAVTGSNALARSREGRYFQTTDSARSWSEVAPPPKLRPNSTSSPFLACSPLGCDLGTWLRVGWEAVPPADEPNAPPVVRAPQLPTARRPFVSCIGTGTGQTRTATPNPQTPDNLGLGVSLLPNIPEDFSFDYERSAFKRSPIVPSDISVGNAAPFGFEAAPRGIMHGFRAGIDYTDRPDGSVTPIVVSGPQKNASALRRDFAFVEPFAPDGPIRRATVNLAAFEKAVRPSGVSMVELVENQGFDPRSLVPITPFGTGKNKSPATDVLVSLSPTPKGTLHLVLRGGSASKAEVFFVPREGIVESAAALSNGDIALLTLSDDGSKVFWRLSGQGVSEIARLPAPPSTSLLPAVPDALAVGPNDSIALVRMPSGDNPPSAADPAWLVVPGPTLTPLAPWSSALPMSDPACVADAAGFHLTIQTTWPWYTLQGAEEPTDVDGSTTGMTARVRWSKERVCIEALELVERAGNSLFDLPTEDIVVATFQTPTAGRVGIEAGVESRAPLSCTLQPQ
ncbi:MAG: hypothetical protein IPK82_18295 [Polyangiaceae bacterium]|nr:hypothetical protein [Polyangiaceae bacterium]